MPNPNHTRRLKKGIVVCSDGRVLITPEALSAVFESMTDKEVIQLGRETGSPATSEQEYSDYCDRVTHWLLEHGKVSL